MKKYYVTEKLYNTRNVLIKENRITGDTTNLEWVKYQMNYRFQNELKTQRKEIKNAGVFSSDKECKLLFKNGNTYILSIEEVQPKEPWEARDILVALNNRNEGDWNKNMRDIQKKPEMQRSWLKLSNSPTCTLLDLNYPDSVKNSQHPPLVLYYKGDIDLLSKKSYVKLAVGMSREPDDKLFFKGMAAIRGLPKNVIIATSDKRIAEEAMAGSKPHKVILVKACGMNKQTPQIDVWIEMKVIQNGGVVVTPYPDETDPVPYRFAEKNMLMGAIADALLIVDLKPMSGTQIMVTSMLGLGKDIMVLPTLPEYKERINNDLIAEGAYLVENAKDIENILKL